MGFLRRNSNGTTGYHFLKNGDSNDDETKEKPLTIGKILKSKVIHRFHNSFA